MELAGVVLGGFPLMLYALDNYRRVANGLKDYLRYDALLARLQDQLFIQEEQFQTTLESIGLQGMSLDEIELHLRRIQPQKSSRFVSIIRRMNETSETVAKKLTLSSTSKPGWSQMSDERLKWEMRRIRRSLEKGELKRLLDELDEWNVGLKNCFEKLEIPSAETNEDRTVKTLCARFNQDRCDAATENAQLLHEALTLSWGCTCKVPHQGCLRLIWHSGQSLAPARFELALSYAEDVAGVCQVTWKHINIAVEQTRPHSPAPSMPIPPTLHPRPGHPKPAKRVMFREALSFGKVEDGTAKTKSSTVGPSSIPMPPPQTLGQITKLCYEVKKCANAAEILGYLFHPNTAVSQQVCVHNGPTKPLCMTATTISPHVSTKGSSTYANVALSRKQRFEIAASVSWAVLLLSNTDWLSEGLGHYELQLMLEKGNYGKHSLLQGMYASSTFGSSKGASASILASFANEPALRILIRNRTIFVLGIMLIELCLGRRFQDLKADSVVNQALGATNSPVDASQPLCGIADIEMAYILADKVHLEAGELYGNAVHRCLRCSFDGRDDEHDLSLPQFRKNFFLGVVAPVQATYDLMSDRS